MSLSRKRRKELKRLRASAEELWGNQQVVLGHANRVAKETKRQLSGLAREEVAPRMRAGYDSYIQPGVSIAQALARTAGLLVERTVIPVAGNALGAVLAIGDVAQDSRVRRAAERMQLAEAANKKKAGFGTYLAIGVGVAATVGVAYAVWQTLRADDELWIADDELLTDPDFMPEPDSETEEEQKHDDEK